MNRIQNTKSNTSHGYSLLELLLALALSVVVIGAISTAIQIYLVSLTKQQAMIERKQVARAVLTMIAKDIRAGIQYKAADYSGLENLFQTQQLMQNPPPVDPDAEETAEEPEDSGIIVEEEVSFRPAMIGTTNVIMMDISRLPRLDQYNPMMTNVLQDVASPSDVKSLAYFVSAGNGGIESEIAYTQARAPGGLYRREIDRAVASYSGDFELVYNPDDYTQLVAHEIAEIGFRYFDGEDWQTDWDSEEVGGFPTAVEITIVIDPERSSPTSNEYDYSGFNQETMETQRIVVDLPVSESTAEEEE
jgi:type II secretory pathway pseudopilin PulG